MNESLGTEDLNGMRSSPQEGADDQTENVVDHYWITRQLVARKINTVFLIIQVPYGNVSRCE